MTLKVTFRSILALSVGLCALAPGQTRPSSRPKAPRFAEQFARCRSSLEAGSAKIMYEHLAPAARGVFVVLSDARNEPAAQVELARLLEAVFATGGVQALMVDGFSGPLEIRPGPSSEKSGSPSRDRLLGELQWGSLRAHEYVSLTLPGTPQRPRRWKAIARVSSSPRPSPS